MKKRIALIALLSGTAFAQVQLGRNVQLGAGGTGPTLDVQTNGVDNLSQTLLDLDQGSNMTITNTSSGHVRFDATTGIVPQVVPPISGQYVVLYPSTGTLTNDEAPGRSTINSTSGNFVWTCSGLLCTIAPTTNANWSGYSLPSYVNPANVTAIYADSITSAQAQFGQMPFSGASITAFNCGGIGSLFPASIASPWLATETTQLLSIPATSISSLSCPITLGRSGSGASGAIINVSAVRLIVYYTGTAPPADTRVQIVPPLTFNADLNQLVMDPLGVGFLQPLTVATLPDAIASSGKIFQVTNGSSSTDCTTGGGSTVNLCRSNGTTWSIFSSGGGGGGLSGQTTGYLPLATSATASTVSSALQDTGSSLVYHGTGTQHGLSFGASSGGLITPLAGSAGIGTDASGLWNAYENGGSWSRLCTVGNALCTGSVGVSSIDTQTGAFTFGGTGVSHVGNAYTFSGASSLPAGTGFYTFYVSAGTTFARNNNTGAVDYSGTDAGAVIRSALANASGTCGTLNFQPGTYNINSLAVDPHVATNFLAISIPNAAGTNQYCEWSVIGDGVPPIMDQFSTPVQTAGVVFNVTSTALSGLTAGQYAIGIGMQAPASGVLGNSLIIKNVDVRFPTNQLAGTYTIGEIDASNAENFTIENSLVDINIAQASIVPATAGFTGIKATNSSHEENRIGRTYSVGAYTGFDLSTEHVTMSDSYALNCVNAIDYGNHSGAGNLYDPSVFINSGWATCQHGLTIGTQVQTGALLDMTGLDFEEAATGSFVPVYRAKEVNNGSTFGRISFTRVTEGVGLSPLANLFDGGGGSGFCKVNSGGPTGACGAGSFSALAGGTNTTAAMLVGSGASLAPTGTGTIQATNISSTVSAGTGIAITGSGTTASPYAIAATGGSSVATVASSETVASSATPTFSTSFNVSYNVLTANVTTFTLAAGSDGQAKTLTFCQNGTGGFTVTPPANVHGFFTVGATASKCSSQHFNYSTAQTAWLADSAGVINE